ncbi:MAG: aminotransferase class V-fold PLP-dependent enzyme [Cyclobacteriaceae bacterium]
MKRRQIIRNIALGLGALPLTGIAKSKATPLNLNEWAFDLDKSKDEAFWVRFRKQFYDVSDTFVNLENGFFGVQPLPVLKAYHENMDRVNQYTSKYMRQQFNEDKQAILKTLAEFGGTEPEELLITRNATEALNILIQGIPLEKGDEIVLQHHDYSSMIQTFQMLEKTRGVKLKFVDVPLVPDSPDQIVKIYKNAFSEKTKCVLLTHLTHLTGQIMPIKQIAKIARSKDIDVIVDAAHSFAQLDYKLPDLGADFVGVNLHKWFSNPLGAGLMYVKKDRIKDLTPLYGDVSHDNDDIDKLGHYGTPATPIVMTLSEAAFFNNLVTIPVKEARLRYLQNYWTSQAKGINRIEVTTPTDPVQSCALASFKIEGMDSMDVQKQLDEKFGVFTVIRKLKDDVVIRVTPNLYNSTADMDKLLEGLEGIATS